MLISESKDFIVSSASLKEIRTFSKDVFAKRDIPQELKDDLVLAIAEASQNIVKHAYNGQTTADKMKVKILFRDNEIEIGFLIQDFQWCQKIFSTENLMILNQEVWELSLLKK